MKEGILLKLFLSAILLAPMSASAQVTIGSANPPSPFSLLDLDATNVPRALHLPRLNSAQRDALAVENNSVLARGLLIFNTDSKCLEFWNETEWISLCDGDTPDPCGGLAEMNTVFCLDETIADLTARANAAGGNGFIRWYDAEVGGNLLHPSTPLVAGTYWADNCAGSDYRIPVSVSIIEFCARITAFTNVMYDFQHQTLEAFHIDATVVITNYEWSVSTDGENFTVLSNGSSSTFEIHPYFIDSYVTNEKSKELYFRCIFTTSTGDLITVPLGIYFIRTNTSGYGIANDVRYLTIQRGGDLNGGEIKIALLNLGASENDGIGLGDFYQWGRVADGHQRTVWTKNASREIVITPMTGGGNATSLVVPRVDESHVDVSTGQVHNPVVNAAGSGFYGNFIVDNHGWGSHFISDLWGNEVKSRTGSPISFDGAPPTWTYRARNNNPCPNGWRVPSIFELWDTYRGNGSNYSPGPISVGAYSDNPANVNTWVWRPMQSNSNALGGLIITNSAGEKVFLPAAGWRTNWNGTFGNAGVGGYYWSSTLIPGGGGFGADALFFNHTTVEAGTNHRFNRVNGYSVRCVSE